MEQAVEELSQSRQVGIRTGGETAEQMLWGKPLHLGSNELGAKATEAARPRYLRFFAWIMVVPTLFYLAAIPLVRARSYLLWSPNLWTARLDYAFNTDHRDADVLIFGDSAAFLGIDPRVVDADLGVRSFVIPATVGSLPYTGEMALRRYLAHNKPPRVLVLYFSAWDMDYLHTTNLHSYEGVEMLLRHGSWGQILDFTRQHPHLAVTFPIRMYSMVLEKSKPYNLRATHQPLPDDMGHFDYKEPFEPEKPDCKMPDIPVLSRSGQATVQQLIQQYSPRMKVVVYLAPIPPCVNASVILNRSYADVGAAPPVVMPAQAFFGDTGYAHIEPAYIAESSHLFAEHLRQQLQHAGLTINPSQP